MSSIYTFKTSSKAETNKNDQKKKKKNTARHAHCC